MTVIVVDSVARVMAADTLVVEEELRSYHTKKIFRCADGAIAGASGDCNACAAFLDWAIGGRQTKLTANQISGLTGAVILQPDGSILNFSNHPRPDVILGGFMAVGAGREVAQGARFMQGTAEECVLAAIQLATNCGGEVTVLHLDHE